MPKDIEVLHITKADLKVAIKDDVFWKDQNTTVPFARNKAKWLLDNPRMEDDDLCAVLAYENHNLVAFIYFIPDLIQFGENSEKIFWFKRWWVAEKYKDSVLSTYTMTQAINAVGGKVLIKYLAKGSAEDFYNKQPYTNFSYRSRYYILFKLESDLLVSRIKFLRFLNFPMKFAGRLSEKLIRSFNMRSINKRVADLFYEYLPELDDNAWNFIKEQCKDDLVPKSKEYVNWQLNNNQYTKTPILSKYPVQCLSISAFYNIESFSYKVILNKKIIGFISYLIRGNEFLIKYFLSEKEYYDLCLDTVIQHFHLSSTNIIQTEDNKLGNAIKKRYKTIYNYNRDIYSLANKNVDFDLSEIALPNHDGNFD